MDAIYARAHVDELDLNARSQWVAKGTKSALHALGKQWEVLALEQLTSHIEQAHNNRDPSRLR